MITCKKMNCKLRGICQLEANGATDLCPVLKGIKDEAITKTETAWADKFPTHEVVPLEHYQGTWTTGAEGFSLAQGLGKIATLELARRKATLDKAAFCNKHKLTPVEPRPAPAKVVRRKSDLDYHEMPTETNDYCAYPPIDHIEDLVNKVSGDKPGPTKKQKQYWRDLKAREKIMRRQDERDIFLLQLLYDMDEQD